MYINDGTGLMAAVLVNANTVAASSVSAGTMNYTLWSSPVSVSTRAVSLKGASFKFIGSAPANAFSNLKLYANGLPISTATGVNSMGYVSFDLSSAPYSMNTGSTVIEVRADIVRGSYRNAQLSLQNASDLMIVDSQLNVNVSVSSPTSGSFASNLASELNKAFPHDAQLYVPLFVVFTYFPEYGASVPPPRKICSCSLESPFLLMGVLF